MKVKGLIDKLKSLPPDDQVLVQGYEGGFDDIKIVREITVKKDPDAHDFNGEYEEIGKDSEDTVSAVVIFGNRR